MSEPVKGGWFLERILIESPLIPGYGGGQWAMYSVGCCWWTSFPDDLGNTFTFYRDDARYLTVLKKLVKKPAPVPCCPHCGSVLYQAPLLPFVQFAQAHADHYGHFGIDAFLEAHSRNAKTCYRSWLQYNLDIWRRFHPMEPPTFA